MNHKKHLPIWALILCDVLLIAATLNVYALFHHVIPAYFNKSAETETHVIVPLNVPEDQTCVSPSEKFSDHFSEEILRTETRYSSPDICIEISEYKENRQHWYLADIIVSNVVSIQAGTPGETYSTAADGILSIAEAHNALVAVNGDYAAFGAGGTIIRNGVIRREVTSSADSLVLYRDGSVLCFQNGTLNAEEVLADGAWQAWTFGPILLDGNGAPLANFPELYNSIDRDNPRTAFGYYEPGHYCFVVVDGRQYEADGMTLSQLADLMSSLGCKAAYNFDGGQSSQMTFGNSLVNTPVDGGRVINDIVFVTENTEEAE